MLVVCLYMLMLLLNVHVIFAIRYSFAMLAEND